ncbi:MAG: DUF3185 family protein [Hydrogenovibrio sp.]|uniref:DUF3185 family protein n=1 Tax=Hydrogenovibrio sp. TaxID=2065821 RepID=UPI0028708C57|nr:DUF3185 family protein [Hydrogenovibrio sp.]MDR9498824.1 DUF3185 family protein [Hydrogenovibrio sp.]
METNTNSAMKIIGIILMVVGAGIVIYGFQLSQSIGSEVTQAVTGSETDTVMAYYVSGAVSFVVGLFFFAKK